jgi:hypothetical protein
MAAGARFSDFDMRIKPLFCGNFSNLALRLRQVTGHAKTQANLAISAAIDYGESV